MSGDEALEGFHPAVREWFARAFPSGPTDAQRLGWSSISSGSDTLISAPTGSGKTLAGFLVAIDRCLRADVGAERATSVIYVSPLRALTVDVRENLERPLREIRAIAAELGVETRDIRVAVRNGDTPQSARAAMARDRPEIVVTTPESLYLLAGSASGRKLLGTVDTVIVDEIHAIARDKRGSHLTLTLERLDRIVAANGGRRPTRIGLSATQRPIETVARLLVGAGPERSDGEGRPACRIVDVGHRRPLEISIELGGDELGAVMTIEQLDEVVELLADEIKRHRTTLVFVNTRRMSERVAHLLTEYLGEDAVAAHHGSLSLERRLRVEDRLRNGELSAVVATASLELGIDIGPVELVCQIGSPRSIATFLQRVGRAEHRVDGIPRGLAFPFTRDELVETTALFGAVRAGLLDVVHPPVAPLDILAQQIVAECAASGEDGIDEQELAALVRRAAPYAALSEEDLESILVLVTDGVQTGRGRRGAHLFRDEVSGVLRARRGARLVAATSGGAIPELADYQVLLEPENVVVGTVHEDFAVEAMSGDVFLLGSTAWRVRRVEQGTVRVVDAAGAAPTIPFWLGEAPSRTNELADAVSELRDLVDGALATGKEHARVEVERWAGVSTRVAGEVVAYLAAGRAELGAMPTKNALVFERFFDDAGGMQFVVHAPFGGRINRGLGLALRKRFCRTFDFELQAAANDDAIVLSLGPQHSFPLEDVTRFLSPETVTEVLTQAVLPTPIFTSRWRWNLGRSLVSPRYRGARHLPPAIQRMEADDLMAAIFPGLAACQENTGGGPIEIPDHPIVRQTLDDCCSEAMDLPGIIELVGKIRSGAVTVAFADTVEPSVLSHEILSGRPYTFLDDAPLEERRTRAVSVRRGIPLEAHDLSTLDEEIVDAVRAEAAPDPRDPDELHDVLQRLVISRSIPGAAAMFAALADAGRAMTVTVNGSVNWCATERRSDVEVLSPAAVFEPDHRLARVKVARERDGIIVDALRGHLEHCGPVAPLELALALGTVETSEVARALVVLEVHGEVLRVQGDRWCAKHLAARIHARQRDRQRQSYRPVPVSAFMRFACGWQHVAPGTRLSGTSGVAAVLDQLQGVEAAVGAWEESILPARISGYTVHLLDELSHSGEVSWGRLGVRTEPEATPRRAGSTPSRATPVALVRREDLAWLLAAARMGASPEAPGPGATGEVLEVLGEGGALFFADLCARTGRLPTEVADALWDGVARGLVTADGFAAVRTLLAGRYREAARRERPINRRPIRSIPRRQPGARAVPPALAGGRWSLLDAPDPAEFEPDELAEAVATQLLSRWGVVFRELARREPVALAWRDVLFALRRLEARGVVRGGRFVDGPLGEQFATPEALLALRRAADAPLDGTTITISASDPLNLTGIVLPGARIPARRGQRIVLVDGLVREELPALALAGGSGAA